MLITQPKAIMGQMSIMRYPKNAVSVPMLIWPPITLTRRSRA
jgi:hypothetical protein